MPEFRMGISRCIDKLGRLCIPVELRSRYEMNINACVEMIPTEEGIFLRKVQTSCVFCQKESRQDFTFKGKRICRKCLDAMSKIQENLDPQ